MAMTTAERQRAFRRRQIDRIAVLEHENARLRTETGTLHATLADARGEHARLHVELADVRAQLADARGETERLTGQACKHPAAAVDAGHCRACGNDIW
jgi:predicted  nucleic acid-binding Zn-ribbon protein